jgi:hypothetical protein
MRRDCSYLHCITLYFPDGQFGVLSTQQAYADISMRYRSWLVTSQICSGSSFCFIGPISWPLMMGPTDCTETCQELPLHAAPGGQISLTSWRKPEITHKTKFTKRFSRINYRLWANGTRNQNDVDFGDLKSGDKPRTQVLLYDHESMRTENGAK